MYFCEENFACLQVNNDGIMVTLLCLRETNEVGSFVAKKFSSTESVEYLGVKKIFVVFSL